MGKYTNRILIVLLVVFMLTVNVQAANTKDNGLKNIPVDEFMKKYEDVIGNQKNAADKMDKQSKAKIQKTVDKEKYLKNNLVVTLEDYDKLKEIDIQEKIVGKYETLDTVVVEIPKGKNIEQIKEKLRKIPGIVNVEQEYIAASNYIPQDPYYQTYQWNLKKINMEGAWNVTKGASNTIIAVIDTGVGAQEDINGVLINGAAVLDGVIHSDINPGDFSYDGGVDDIEVQDSSGFPIYPHGTAVAAVIASSMNTTGITGIAPNVKIMPIKVFKDGEGHCSFYDVALAIRWAADHGADIINLSLGGPVAPNELLDAVDYAYSKGVTIVGASGNDGIEQVSYPAYYDHVIAVGSTGSGDNASMFSNHGSRLDIVAPGENIYTPYIGDRLSNPFLLVSGTSFSSPTIAGVAGLIKSKYSSLTNDQITRILYTASKDLTSVSGWDANTGYGRVEALAALNLAANNSIWDYNDTISTSTTLGSTAKVSGKLYPAQDKDVYKLSITKPGNIKAIINSANDFDLMMILTDENGNVIDYIDDGGGSEKEVLDTTITNAGIYYLWVLDYYGDFSDNISYHLEMNPVAVGQVSRYAGADKWNTAALISNNGWVQSDNVILAYGNNFPDALAGAPIASHLNAPILLTSRDAIPACSMNEIIRLKPKTIYLLGGNLVISDSLEKSLKNKGYNVKRIFGADKYKTAIAIGQELINYYASDTIVLAYGGNYPDALSIGGFAGENKWPLLFTGNKTLNTDTKKAILNWDIKKVIIVGGNLVVSTNTENELKNMGITVERIAGEDKWETSIKIVKKFKAHTDGVIISTGNNYPDALTGGAFASKYSYPILLVQKNNATSSVLSYIGTSGADRGVILGGTSAVSNTVQNQVYSKIN
ncbi:MAG: cell wall-binding repeat-containing protein [Eubacteriales bacterium]